MRPVYKQFESDLKTGTTEIYYYEMPGGQYSNFKSQVESFGLGHRLHEVKDMYKAVNKMFGDIVKVTPTSKVVGDMAIFMVQNDLTPENIVERGSDMDFPDSVVSYFEGMMGQPEGGFYPDECMDIYDAVDAYTYESAYAEFEENVKGRIKPGYYADMVILSQDIFTIPSDEIINTKVDATIVDGRFVYER